MRKSFSNTIKKIAKNDDKIVFLTGDLGFNALEDLRLLMGERFINCGVAEQSMISIAAGMAHKGFSVFCYSIAPFVVYRALEQIRNDVCFHNLPVFIVGNGGGYGYGIMGPTHHAIEDISCMSCLPNMQCYIPAFIEDLDFSLSEIIHLKTPAYLRLGLGNMAFENSNIINGIRHNVLNKNPIITIASSGPIVSNIIEATKKNNNYDMFSFFKMPISNLENKFVDSIKKSKKLLIVEEHVTRGGFAENLCLLLIELQINISVTICSAKGYPGNLYGNQKFHQKLSELDADSLNNTIFEILNDNKNV